MRRVPAWEVLARRRQLGVQRLRCRSYNPPHRRHRSRGLRLQVRHLLPRDRQRHSAVQPVPGGSSVRRRFAAGRVAGPLVQQRRSRHLLPLPAPGRVRRRPLGCGVAVCGRRCSRRPSRERHCPVFGGRAVRPWLLGPAMLRLPGRLLPAPRQVRSVPRSRLACGDGLHRRPHHLRGASRRNRKVRAPSRPRQHRDRLHAGVCASAAIAVWQAALKECSWCRSWRGLSKLKPTGACPSVFSSASLKCSSSTSS